MRRQHNGVEEHAEHQAGPGVQGTPGKQEWHELSGEPRIHDLFDHEIVERMGKSFYTHVFFPAIQEALAQGRSYESIRDTIRKDWKSAR